MNCLQNLKGRGNGLSSGEITDIPLPKTASFENDIYSPSSWPKGPAFGFIGLDEALVGPVPEVFIDLFLPDFLAIFSFRCSSMDWRKLFGCSTGLDLEFHPPRVSEGSISVHPPPEVLEAGIDEWKLSLVGQFLGAALNFATMQRIADNLWKKALGGSKVHVSFAGNNLYVFSFKFESIRDWILENGPCHILNKPLILRKWEPNLNRLQFDLSRIPVWVHLFNVPLELFSRNGLSYIASAIDSPLTMDSVTAARSHLEFAKVCIEIGANDVIPKFVNMVIKDGKSISIVVEVPWLPSSCISPKSPDVSVLNPIILNSETLVDNTINSDVVSSVTKDEKIMLHSKSIADSSEILSTSQPKLVKNNSKLFVSASNNRFEVLSVEDESSIVTDRQQRKIRSASLGVARIVNELKMKKKDNLVKAKNAEVDGSGGYHSGLPFIITVVYGSNDGRERRLLWHQLRDLDRNLGHFPWIIGGDFNIILNSNESFDFDLLGHSSSSDMRDFQEILTDLDLFDHPFFGPTFTWSISDHCLALLWIHKEMQANRPKPFKFFNFWTLHPNFMSLVEKSWFSPAKGNRIQILFSKIKLLKTHLKTLNNSFFSELSYRVNSKRAELEQQQLKTLKVALKNKRDTIRLLIDDQGNRLESFDAMSTEIINFFSNLLGSSDPTVKSIDPNLLRYLLHSSIPAEFIADLTKDITMNEIKEGFFSQGNDKAPGPDGYSPLFFKLSWAIIGEDTTAAIK
ncbi:uncharacterized protein LOC120137070 [Hibiscus syriacus]|uniref:uncharacterized protein LOC120137070 n=1 Tax=Hibiscus syriacus TaxID=106335 RepID=UPI001923230B|nr:uncharacterized protein LOC120137070 [Hibiscus syriacus]